MSMTPMNNFDYLERVKFSEELAEIEAAKKASGMTYEELAEKIGVNKVWLTSAIKGQQYIPIKVIRILYFTDYMRCSIPMVLQLKKSSTKRAVMPL